MLSDKVRTETYRDSVAKNLEAIKGKKVLDLGCGTGILSMFCARHGQAEQVVGVDMSSIAHQAMDIVMENNLADTITIVKVPCRVLTLATCVTLLAPHFKSLFLTLLT